MLHKSSPISYIPTSFERRYKTTEDSFHGLLKLSFISIQFYEITNNLFIIFIQ